MRVVYDAAGHAGDEDYAAGVGGGDHSLGAGLGDEEGACYVDVEEAAEFFGLVGFGFDVGAVEKVGQSFLSSLLSKVLVEDTYSAMPAAEMRMSIWP